MNWLLTLYSFYFVLLAVSVGLYAADFSLEGAGIVVGIVSAHFVAGTVQYLRTNVTLQKRYSQPENLLADLMLSAALVFGILSVTDPCRIEWYYSAFTLALVGNTFCVVGHLRKTPEDYVAVRAWPFEI